MYGGKNSLSLKTEKQVGVNSLSVSSPFNEGCDHEADDLPFEYKYPLNQSISNVCKQAFVKPV